MCEFEFTQGIAVGLIAGMNIGLIAVVLLKMLFRVIGGLND